MSNMFAPVNLIFNQKGKFQSFQVHPAHSQSIMLDLCLCEESKACRIIYNMIICSLLFWILVSSRTFHKLIICTVSLILEMYWLGYVTFTFRNTNIVSVSLLEGSSLIYQPTCIKHGNAEVPRILGSVSYTHLTLPTNREV